MTTTTTTRPIRYTACRQCGEVFRQTIRQGRPYESHPDGCPLDVSDKKLTTTQRAVAELRAELLPVAPEQLHVLNAALLTYTDILVLADYISNNPMDFVAHAHLKHLTANYTLMREALT